ncbi:MAG: aryl-sulfate sulfotransferase, partial [Candidatus Thorarchaeota archaeon]
MKKSAMVSILILLMITASLSLTNGTSSRKPVALISHDTSSDVPLQANQEYIDDIKNSLTLTNYSPSQAMNGLNLFAVWAYEPGSAGLHHSVLLVTDMEGTLVTSRETNGIVFDSEFIDSKTIMYMDPNNPDNPGVYLWDIDTNSHQLLPFPAGLHDVEYNPFTNTFLTLQFAEGEYNGAPMWFDDIVEYSNAGVEQWRWNSSFHIPFNETEYTLRNERGRRGAEYYHTNSIFWDMEEDVIYYNARNLDTFYKINKTSGEIIWAAGRMGDLDLYDISGEKRSSLWYHSHAVEMVSPNRFVMFDNDYWNLTRRNKYGGTSRLIEISIDDENMRAREEWVWVAPQDYSSVLLGDADRMPNGNTIGTFGFRSDALGFRYTGPRITEVTQEGDIVWEFRFTESEYEYNIYRHERYLENIQVEIS